MTTVAQGVQTESLPRRPRVSLIPYLFILPHLIFFAVFVGYPFFSGIYYSFHNYDYLRPERTTFIALQNYIDLFTPGSVKFNEFWTAVRVTVEFVVYSVPLLILIPLGLAVLLNSKLPGTNAFRSTFFAPWALSAAVISLIWWWIFQSQGGLLNYYLDQLNLPTPRWLSTLPYAMWAIVIATVWWTMGYNMIILLAALQDIPEHLYEAAKMDGANGWQQFWYVTLPSLRPVMVLITILTVIASFNLLGQPMIMTRGDPRLPGGGGGTEPVMLRIFTEGFVRPFQGSAAAMSVIVAIMMMVVSYVGFRVFQRKE